MTKKEAIEMLRELDHAFVTPEGVKEITEPFGFEGTMYTAKDNRSEFKGLYVPEGKEGNEWRGQDADRLAMQICDHLGLKYQEFFGRGSQLRHCCDVIEKYLEGSSG